MKKDAYYTSGQFAKKAHVTLRAIRYYDKQNILKPSARTAAGARLYTDADLAKLQQILLLKYLGFSLEDIREMTLAAADQQYLLESMRIQKKLLRQKMDEMQAMDEAIDRTIEVIQTEQAIDWNSMLDLMHLTAVERSLKTSTRMRQIFPPGFACTGSIPSIRRGGFRGLCSSVICSRGCGFWNSAVEMEHSGPKTGNNCLRIFGSFSRTNQKEC